MRTFKRLFCVLLALAALCGVVAVPVGAADSKYQLTVSKIQRLTPGTAFAPDSAPDVTNVSPGDILVLTVAFRNNTASAMDINGFLATLRYDPAQVKPYTGTTPFQKKSYQLSPELLGDYGWTATGNAGENFVAVAGGSADMYTVKANSALTFARVAFQVNKDASGTLNFTFDTASGGISVTSKTKGTLPLDAPQPVQLPLGGTASAYEITAVSADRVTLTNPAPVTLAVSYFDANGQFMSASTQSVPANAGSVPVTFQSAHKVYVMLFDDSFRPLCERCLYVSK